MEAYLSVINLGYLAAFLTSISYIPQALRTIRTKDTKSLSLGTYFLLSLGVLLWLIYGLFLGDGPIIVANVITLSLCTTILLIKIRNQISGKENEQKDG